MPVCSEMPWGGPFHGPYGPGRGRGGRGWFGFGGCGRGGFTGWDASKGPWGFWGHHGPHHGHHHGPHHGPPHHSHGHHHEHHHHGPHRHGPHHRGPAGPCGGSRGRSAGCRGGMGGSPMRGRGGFGPCGRGWMGPWRWGPSGMGPRRWHCRPGAFDAPFDETLLMAMFLNFDLPIFSRDGDTGEDVPPAAAAPSGPQEQPRRGEEEQEEATEANIIRIDTRRFSPQDIRVSFSEGQLRVTAVHTDENGEEVTLRRSASLRPGSKVTAKLGVDGYLYIKSDEPAARTVNVEVAEEGDN